MKKPTTIPATALGAKVTAEYPVTLDQLLALRAFGLVSYLPRRGFVAMELDGNRIRPFLRRIGGNPK